MSSNEWFKLTSEVEMRTTLMATGSALLLGTGCRLNVAPEALRIHTEVTPVVSKQAGDSAVVRVKVAVRNPYPWPARVHLGGPPYRVVGKLDAPHGIGFTYQLYRVPDGQPRTEIPRDPQAQGPGGRTWGQPDVLFGPWQAVVHEFTVHVNASRGPGPRLHRELTPGEYLVVAGFAHISTPPQTVTIRP